MISSTQNNLDFYNRLVTLNNCITDPQSEKNFFPVMQDCLLTYLNNNPQLLTHPIDRISGDTWLHKAVKDKKIYLINLLILNNANTEARNSADQTPKDLAAKYQLTGIQWRVSSLRPEKSEVKQSQKTADVVNRVNNFSFSSCFMDPVRTQKTADVVNRVQEFSFSSCFNNPVRNDYEFFPTAGILSPNEGPKNKETKNIKAEELVSLDLLLKQMLKALSEKDKSSARKVIKEVSKERKAEFYHLAVSKGCVDILEFLNTNGFNFSAKNAAGQTALHTAVLNCQEETARFLFFMGISAFDKDCHGNTPVHYAAKQRNLHLVKLLTLTNDTIPKENNEGLTPLAIAARAGHVTIVQFFLAYKKEKIDFLAKLKAIEVTLEGNRNQAGVLQQFLRHDQNFIKEFLVYQKSRPEYVKIAEILKSITPDRSTKLNYAKMTALSDNLEELIAYVKEQVDRGVNIDAEIENGYTCLHMAVRDGNLPLVQCLIEVANANINSLTNNAIGYSPLHFAAEKKNDDMIDYLVWMGAYKDIRSKNGSTPMRMSGKVWNSHKSAFYTSAPQTEF